MQIANRYTIIETIGKGGMGVIYKASDEVLSKIVAVKMLINCSEIQLQRFQLEAKAIAQLNHHNIIKVLDFGLSENTPYMVMEYVAGNTLSELLKNGRLPLPEALPIASQICQALRHAHEKGILHRDIKPSNVMLVPLENGTREAKLLDFGIAKILSADQSLTASGLIIGSPNYMSPEQIKAKEIDERADVYSFGILLFEMLSGRLPFQSDSSLEVMKLKLLKATPTLQEATGIEFNTLLENILSTCLEKEPENRFSSFAEVLNRLEEIDNQPSSTTMETSQKKAVSLVGIALVVLLVSSLAVTAFLVFSNSKAPEKLPGKARPTKQPSSAKEDDSVAEAKVLANPDCIIQPSPNNGPYCKITFPTDKDLEQFVTNYSYVTRLDISNYRGEGAGLKSLRSLDLQHLTLSITDDLATKITPENLKPRWFKHLTGFQLEGTKPDDAMIDEIVQAKSLEKLELCESTNFTKSGMSALKRLPKLNNLNFTGAGLTDELISGLRGIKNLQTIYLHRNPKITADGIRMLKPLQLEVVEVDTPRSKTDEDALYEALGSLSTVTTLLLRKVEMEKLTKLAAIAKLKQIYLQSTSVSDKGIRALKDLRNLQNLALAECELEDDKVVLKEIGKLTISDLRLINTDVSLEAIEQLKGNTTLKNLGIVPADKLAPEKAKIQAWLPHCELHIP